MNQNKQEKIAQRHLPILTMALAILVTGGVAFGSANAVAMDGADLIGAANSPRTSVGAPDLSSQNSLGNVRTARKEAPEASGTPAFTNTPTRTSTATATHTATSTRTSTSTYTATSTPTPCVPVWSLVAGPNPGSVNNTLSDISVVAPNDIWGVGFYGSTSSITQTLTVHWNGTSWSQVPSPSPGSVYNEIWDVVALSANDVWAVGHYGSVGGVARTLIEHWNGSFWSVVSSPNIGPSANYLLEVSAASSNDVWTVGQYIVGSNFRTLIEHWNGSSWQVSTSPNPGSDESYLDGVAAVSANDAWAVGRYRNGSVTQTLIMHWDGAAWSTASSPNPSPSFNHLYGVEAISSTNVWAIGYTLSGNAERTLIEHWDGSSWFVVPSPSPGSAVNALLGLVPISNNDIWAVGRTQNGALQTTLTEHWNGSSWSVVPSLSPGTSLNWLHAVDAVSSSEVWAVGVSGNGSTSQTLIERYGECAPIETPTPTPTPGIYCVSAAGGATGAPCTNHAAYTTLQAGIDAANNGSEVRIANGTYYGTGNAVGVVSRPITVTGGYTGGTSGWMTPGPYTGTSVHGQSVRNAFEVQGGATVSINNLSITSGGIQNNGTVKIDSSTLRINGVGTISGNYAITTTALLDFNCICTLADGTSITGTGFARSALSTNALDVPGAATIRNLNLGAGTITGAGTLTVAGVLAWTGGGMLGTGVTYIAPSAQLNIAYSTAFISLDRRTLNNAGMATWSNATQFYFYNGGILNNSGVFEVRNTLGLNGTGTFNNTGTFRKASDLGNVAVNDSGVAFNSSGTIEVPNSTLTISNNIPFTMLAGAQITGAGFLKVGAGPSTLVNIAGPTTAQNLNFAGGTITGTNTLTVTGVLSWTGGSMSGTGVTYIPPSAQLNMAASTASVLLNRRTLNNAGTANWTLSNQFYVVNGGTFNNSGLFDVQNTLGVPSGSVGTFNNTGTLRKRAGYNFTGANTLVFNNLSTGVIAVESGQMYLYQFSNVGGTLSLNGGTFTGTPLNLQSGTLIGQGTVSAQITNGGLVSPGASPGVITATLSYTQYLTGTLNIELGGPTPATQYDQMRVTGAATLNGTLNLGLINGYTPSAGATFTILTHGSRTGTFSTINGGCSNWSITYNAGNVVATYVSSIPACTPTPTPVTPTATATPTPTMPPISTGTATPTPCTGFSDVPPGSTFYPYVTCLVSRGIVGGYADCTFRPNNNVTRGQLSKIVSNAAGFSDPPTGQTFEDVPPGSTFYNFVFRLSSRGIVGGYPCGGPNEPCVAPGNLLYFRPGNNATRGQISKIVSNAAGFSDPPTGQTFEDVPSSSTFYNFVFRLSSRGIVGGYPCGGPNEPCGSNNLPYFRPGNIATRGQVSKIVANAFFPGCQP